jgi:YD repeat-containing protein
VWRFSAAFLPPDALTPIDVDADGAVDLVNLTSGQSHAGRVRFSDLLTEFDNGIGGLVRYEYKSGVAQNDPALDTLADSVITSAEGVVVSSTAPVLSARAYSGKDVVPFRQELTYSRRRILPGLHSSQGFALVEAIGGLVGTEYTYYAQRQGLSGSIVRKDRADSAKIGRRLEFEYSLLAGDDAAVGAGSTAGVRVGRLRQQTSKVLYDPFLSTETAGPVYTEAYEYTRQGTDPHDGYGFVTKVTATRPTGGAVTTRRLAPPDTTRWIVQLPAQVLVKSGTSELSKTEFQYTTSGRPERVTAFDGDRGNLSSASTRITSRTYDKYGNVRSETDPKGRVLEMCYDGDTKFANGVTNCGITTTATAHAINVATLDPLGEVTTYKPDVVTGDITEILRVFSGDRETFVYDVFGRATQVKVKPSGLSEVILADQAYFDVTNATGQVYVERLARMASGSTAAVRSATYVDGFGKPVRTVDEAPLSGTTKRYFGTAARFDAEVGVAISTLPAACSNAGANAHCPNLIDGNQPRVREFVDDGGRPTRIETPDGVSLIDYRRVMRRLPGATADEPFDAILSMSRRGHLVQRIFEGDRLVWVEECSNAPSPPSTVDLVGVNCSSPVKTFYRYEPLGQIAEIYDAKASSLTDPNQATLRFVFDSLGRIRQTRDINKDAVESTIYDAAGNVQSQTNARSQEVTFEYDALDRMIGMAFPAAAGARSYTLAYDARTRQLKTVTQSQTAPAPLTLSVQQYTYDTLGRRNRESVKILARPALVAEQDFDLLGRVTRIRTPDTGTVLAYEYEGAYLKRVCELNTGSSCSASAAGKYLSNIQYDSIGRQISLVGPVPSGASAAHLDLVYSPTTQRLTDLDLVPSAGTGVERLDLAYAYDADGNVRIVTDGSDTSGGAADVPYGVSYEYDARNRLNKRTRAGSDIQHFTYDSIGNLTGKGVATAGATNTTYDLCPRSGYMRA